MEFLQSISALLLQPSLYTTSIAVILAFYLVWALARQQYLGTFQQFDVLAISLIGGIIGIFATQILFPGSINVPWPLDNIAYALSQPFTLSSLAVGYIAAGLATWRYITRIHYPYWRVIDSNSLGIALIELGWLLGMLLTNLSVTLAITTVVWAVLFLVMLALHQRTNRPGITAGVHLVAIFGLCLGLQYTLVSWQGISSIVEYSVGGLAVIAGLVVMYNRLRMQVPHTTLTQLPAGVSQKFRDTFARALLSKQPSKSDGSSHKKEPEKI